VIRRQPYLRSTVKKRTPRRGPRCAHVYPQQSWLALSLAKHEQQWLMDESVQLTPKRHRFGLLKRYPSHQHATLARNMSPWTQDQHILEHGYWLDHEATTILACKKTHQETRAENVSNVTYASRIDSPRRTYILRNGAQTKPRIIIDPPTSCMNEIATTA
jgi:hypothetical protein